MVAIVTGARNGIETTSAFVLGSRGTLGDASLGAAGDNVTVNAATGNLFISRTDEVLISRSPTAIIGRSYNSLGTMNDDNGDNWRASMSRKVTNLTGTVNTAGSTVTRTDWDGSEVVYQWYAAANAYVSYEGAGARNYLTFASNEWTWTNTHNGAADGFSEGYMGYVSTEKYDHLNGGRITALRNELGFGLTFSYTGSVLTRVTTVDGDYTELTWAGNNLTQVKTFTNSGTISYTRTRYGYDATNRLTSVTVDLTPTDNSIADGNTYVTTYTYEGTSKRVASIAQSDGSLLEITYTLVGTDYRVASTTQTVASGVTRITGFSYNTTTRTTTITDPLSNVTTLTYDVQGQLLTIVAPPAVAGGATQTTQFSYNANGDVTSMTSPLGQVTSYSYDAKGQMTERRDAAGNVEQRTYGQYADRIIASTIFLVPDPDGAGAGTASSPVTSRYVYDAWQRLVFEISAEGHVTQYVYGGWGMVYSILNYTGQAYDLTGLSTTQAPSQTNVDAWVAGLSDKSTVQRTDFTFDYRGNVSTETSYSLADTAGAGLTTQPYSRITYVYSASGQLLSRLSNASAATETYVYDGLGRITSSTDRQGAVTSTSFTSGGQVATVTMANGLVQTSTRNLAGELISQSESGTGYTTGTASYKYDALGRLRMVTDATARKSFYLYDNIGRKVADIAADGSITEYGYDAANRLVRTIGYANKLTSPQIASLFDPTNGNPMNVALAAVRPSGTASDVWEWRIYDSANRLIEVIDGDGGAAVFAYDGMSSLVKTTQYSNKIAAATVTGYKTTTPTTLQLPTANAAKDTVSRNFYNADGQLIGSLDAAGYFTQSIYDEAGQQIRAVTFANNVSGTTLISGTYAQVVTAVGTNARDRTTHFAYDGRGLLRYTIDANLRPTEYVYNADGNVMNTIDYGASINSGTTYTLSYIQGQITSLALAGNAATRSSWSVYDAAGRLAFGIDANGGVVAFGYDAMGRVIKQTSFATLRATTSSPDLATMNSWATSNASHADNRVTRTVYDLAGRVAYSVDGGGYVTEFRYDSEDRVTLQIRYASAYSVSDGVTQSSLATLIGGTIPATAVQTSFSYDPVGRLSETTDGTGSVTRLEYDALGRVTDQTVAYGTGDAAVTRTTYDAVGRVATVIQGFGQPEASTTSYSYDGMGNMLTMVDGRGFTTTYTYDVVGQLLTVVTPFDVAGGTAVTTYAYDAFGQAIVATDARGYNSYSFYDKLGRVVFQIDQEGYATGTSYGLGGEIVSVTRYHGKVGGTIVPTAIPLITSNAGDPTAYKLVTNAAEDATTVFTRDKLGRVTRVTDAIGGYENYTLNAFGDRTTVRNKLGGDTTNAFDKRGLLISETLPITSLNASGNPVSVINNFQYDARGNRTQMVEASGLPEARTTTYTYDKLDRLTQTTGMAVAVAANAASNPGSPVAAVENLYYDMRGNIIESRDAAGGRTLSYFDDLNRRIAQLNPVGALSTWTFDANGNVLTARVYGDLVPIPTNAGGTPPAPIVPGNYRETIFTYDPANRLTTSTVSALRTGSFTTSYATSDGAVTTTNHYDKAGNIIRQVDGRGNSMFYYYDKLGRKIAQVDQENYLTSYALDADGNVMRETRYATRVSAPVIAGGNPPAINLIPNSDFTQGLAGWMIGYNPNNIVLAGSPYTIINVNGTNTNAIKAEFAATAAGQVASLATTFNIPVVAGDYLAVQIGIEGQGYGVVGTQRLAAWFVDGNGVGTTATVAAIYGPQATNTKIGGFVEVPPGAVAMRLELYVDTAGAGSGTFYLSQPIVAAVPKSLSQIPAFTANPGGVAGLADARTTVFTYDRNGRRLTEERLGVTSWNVNAASGTLTAAATTATIAYTYNGLGQVTRKTEANGDYTQYDHDLMGRQTSMTSSAFTDYNAASVQRSTINSYNGLNNLTRTVQNGTRTTTFAYDGAGQMTSMVDPSTAATYYHYDISGRLVREYRNRQNSAGVAQGWEGSTTQYDAAGRVTAQGMRLWNGTSWLAPTEETRIAYNAYGEAVGRGINATTQESFSYDAGGRVWRSTAGDGTVRLFLYDASGNQTLTISSSGAAPVGYNWSSLTIDQAVALLTNNGAAAIGTVNVPGMVVTITVYDKRGQAIDVREPLRSTTNIASPTVTISNKRSYNAFGEVTQETDARNNVTDFLYNTMGKVIERKRPTVAWTAENGATANARPTETYYYDLSGRVVGVRDANNNLNTRSLLSGTGHGGEEALVVKEFHADGGVFTNGYDVFNDLRVTVNEIGKTEAFTYDGVGRVTVHAHEVRTVGSPGNPGAALQLTDYYSYDIIGNRLKHWNSQLGSGVADATDYDAQGRVISSVDMGGNTTTYSYAWSDTLATTGLGSFGGWTKTTVNAAGLTATEKTDYFGRMIDKVDYGAHDYAFTYDLAGRLTNRTNSLGENITTSYYNTGLVASVSSTYSAGVYGSTITSSYQYDVDGNRTFEGYSVNATQYNWYSGTPFSYVTSHQSATVTWDAANRMTSFTDTGASGSTPVTINWEYDLTGNIRRMKADYRVLDVQGTAATTPTTQEYWYKYDSMNRFVTTKGMLSGTNSGGTVVIGDAARGLADASIKRSVGPGTAPLHIAGMDIAYNAAGQRTALTRSLSQGTQYFTYLVDQREDYSYTSDGYLASTSIGQGVLGTPAAPTTGTLRATYTRDAMGRVTGYNEYTASGTLAYSRTATYNSKSQVTQDITTSVRSDGTYISTTNYDFNLESSPGSGVYTGAYQGGVVTHSRTTTTKNGTAQPTSDTKNSYTWWDNALQATTSYKPDVNQSTTNTSTFYYDDSGRLQSVDIRDGRPRTVSFITDGNGMILQRDEVDNLSTGDPRELHYYFNGMRVGDISNNGTSDVDYATSIMWHTQSPGTGPFRNGLSYGSSYADFDLSYDPINGLNYESTASRYTVNSGDTLESIAAQLWGDASFWYMIADANGLSGSETLVEGMSLLIPNKIHNSHNNTDTYKVYDPNEAIGDTSPTAAKPPKKGCGALGQILLVAIAVAVTVITAGAAAAPAGQGIFAGLGALAAAGTAGGMALGTAIAIGAGAAALGSIVSQGIGVAVGIQDKFSFKGVALSALAGGVSAGLGGVNVFGAGAKGIAAFGNAAARGILGSTLSQGIGVATGLQSKFDFAGVAAAGVGTGVANAIGGSTTLGRAGASMAGGIAGAASTSLVTGTNFGDTIMSQLPGIIGNTIGNMLANAVAGNGKSTTPPMRIVTASAGDVPLRVPMPKGPTSSYDGDADEAIRSWKAAHAEHPELYDIATTQYWVGEYERIRDAQATGAMSSPSATELSNTASAAPFNISLSAAFQLTLPLAAYDDAPPQQYMLGNGSTFTGTPSALASFNQQRTLDARNGYVDRVRGSPISGIALGVANGFGASTATQNLIYGLASSADGFVMAYGGVRGGQFPGIGNQLELKLPQNVGINGNSKLSPRTAYLYTLSMKDGTFLKNGVTQNLSTRYTRSFMEDKVIDRVAAGPRADMLALERQITIANPGPLNKEPWAVKARKGN